MSRLPKQDWVDEDAVASLDAPDPLRAIFARNRARRGGETHPPSPEPADPPLSLTAPPRGGASESPPLPEADAFALRLVYDANRSLSGAALKILIAALQRGQDAPVSLSQFMQQTKLSKNTVIAGIRECLDWGWLTRRQVCGRCLSPLPDTDGEKVSDCAACGRKVAPQPHYAVHNPNPPVQILNSPVENMNSPVHFSDSLPVHLLNSPAQLVNSPVQNLNSPPVHQSNSPVEKVNTAPVHFLDSSPVQNLNRYQERVGSILSRNRSGDAENKPTPVQIANSPPVEKLNRSRMRADSETNIESRIDSESRPEAEGETRGLHSPEGRAEEARNATGGTGEAWKQTTEQMARHSCQELEKGTGSLGFHITAWNHARKLDKAAKKGRPHTDALFALLAGLTQRRKETGQAQGAAWTRRVRKYFDEQGQPLLSKAEKAEAEELHGTWAGPPAL